MFFAFKTLERKSNENLLCMHCRNLRTVQFTCTVLGFFFIIIISVLIVLIFFKKKTRFIRETIFFSRKTSIEWIKFTRTVISILYLIVFYLILLQA